MQQSYWDGKGMLGIYIHQFKDPRSGLTDYKGRNPFENIDLTNSNPRRYLSYFYSTYDWVFDDAYRLALEIWGLLRSLPPDKTAALLPR
jgi:hypothetical protein